MPSFSWVDARFALCSICQSLCHIALCASRPRKPYSCSCAWARRSRRRDGPVACVLSREGLSVCATSIVNVWNLTDSVLSHNRRLVPRRCLCPFLECELKPCCAHSHEHRNFTSPSRGIQWTTSLSVRKERPVRLMLAFTIICLLQYSQIPVLPCTDMEAY